MSTPVVIFYALMTCWLFTEVYYKQALSSGENDTKGKDKSTLSLLWIVIMISIGLSFAAANTVDAGMTDGIWIYYLRLLLLFMGIVLRMVIVKSLGRYFTVDVTIREDHQIKKDGFYRFLRHPSYSMSLLTFLGLGLFLNNWLALAIAFIPPFLAFSYRIRIEEQALTEQFGDEYTSYKKQTKKIIPFIY
jgi:protein-S-isoprenylcysteine O-methyltransferase Ste14